MQEPAGLEELMMKEIAVLIIIATVQVNI